MGKLLCLLGSHVYATLGEFPQYKACTRCNKAQVIEVDNGLRYPYHGPSPIHPPSLPCKGQCSCMCHPEVADDECLNPNTCKCCCHTLGLSEYLHR